MSKQHTIAKQNRQRNAGGVKPDAFKMTVTLVKLFNQFRRSAFKDLDQPKFLVVILYLWLTNQLDEKRDTKNNLQYKIPDCCRVSASDDCQAHSFRTVKYGSITYAEYALPYCCNGEIIFLWQPLPENLNHLFQPFIAAQPYKTPWLTQIEKQRLIELLSQKWLISSELKGRASARKDIFFRYFANCTRVDNKLSSVAKSVLLPEHRRHHKSAIAYQQEDSDRLRYKILIAQGEYLERLLSQARLFNWGHLLSINSPNSNSKVAGDKQASPHLISKRSARSMPKEWKAQGRISQLRRKRNQRNWTTQADQKVYIGSERGIAEHEVSHFFKILHEKILSSKPTGHVKLGVYIDYYNLCTYHLALLFILLTGTRPTHAISIERKRCFSHSQTCVNDKGRLRPIILSDYMSQQLSQYLELQKSLITHLPTSIQSNSLWFLYDHSGQPKLLNAKLLREFMHVRFPGKVPYMLRHVFAQCALTSIEPVKLSVSQIDRLMGHSEFGEHFGSDHLLPVGLAPLKLHLNSLPTRFKLMEVCYV
ncbi:hypothetical protein AB4298_20805 [Shewanella sp. 10N.261.52.F9]|uniref:hypothetical protein n=1 Tax=Shewanella sp. 10N.261.52.F9 TaxID=3229684 RepID=UPI00354E4C3F